MAGHSQFKNIMHRKGAQDAKRTKLFTKILREVSVAAKINSDPEHNPRLRTAMINARDANLPKDRIQSAIAKASSTNDTTNYDEMRYEGYGPQGFAFIVEALTDNKNRTASEVRAAFTKFGGQLGEMGSVNFMFKRLGIITYSADVGNADEFLEAAIEAGADDCQSNEDSHEIACEPEALNMVRETLEKKFGSPQTASITWKPNTIQTVDHEHEEKILKFLDMLDDCDDVQNVIGNYEFSEESLKKMNDA